MMHWRLKHSATVMTCPKVPTVLSSELPRQLAHRRRSRPTWSKGNHPSSAPIHSARGDPGDLWALVASRSRRRISITEPNLTCGTSHEISTLQSNRHIVGSSSPKAHPFQSASEFMWSFISPEPVEPPMPMNSPQQAKEEIGRFLCLHNRAYLQPPLASSTPIPVRRTCFSQTHGQLGAQTRWPLSFSTNTLSLFRMCLGPKSSTPKTPSCVPISSGSSTRHSRSPRRSRSSSRR